MLEKTKSKLKARKKSGALEWDLRSNEGSAVPEQDLPDFDPEAVVPQFEDEVVIDVER